MNAINRSTVLLMAVLGTVSGQTYEVPKDAVAQGGAGEKKDPPPTPQAAFNNFTWKGIKLSGILDGYYSASFNDPGGEKNQLRNFDINANKMDLNMLKFAIEKSPEPVGFRLDLGFGRAFQVFQSSEPTRRVDQLEPVMQAFVSLKPKAFQGVQVDVGKFYTTAGAEVTETHLNWNYSRALLYANGPYYHFGVRTTLPTYKGFTAGFQVVNGWNNVIDNNSGKTFGFTGSYTKGRVTYSNVYYVGPEKFNQNEGYRHFWDQVLLINVNSKLSTYVNFDLGAERMVSAPSAKFYGMAWAYRYQLSKRIAFANRYEVYRDAAGFISGTAQTLKEATFTGELKLVDGVLTRFEYRNDWSNRPYYEKAAGKPFAKSQPTFVIGLIGYFGPKS
ncbi:MAG: outer membrane beta-barrel protein [Bryobacteraceae bacterium]